MHQQKKKKKKQQDLEAAKSSGSGMTDSSSKITHRRHKNSKKSSSGSSSSTKKKYPSRKGFSFFKTRRKLKLVAMLGLLIVSFFALLSSLIFLFDLQVSEFMIVQINIFPDQQQSTKPKKSKQGTTPNYGPASWAMKPDRPRHQMTEHSKFESYNRFGVSTTTTKSPKFHISPQITNPVVHSKTGKRTFGCLRDTCRGLALEDLSNRKWSMIYNTAKTSEGGRFKEQVGVRLTWLESDTTELTKLHKERPELYNTAYKAQVGKTYLSVLEGADAIGGNKGQQLRVKQTFVRRNSVLKEPQAEPTNNQTKKKKKRKRECTYNDLSLQPAQYRLYIKEECEAFLATAGTPTSFLLKPETGSQGKGITFHSGVESVKKKAKKFFPCAQNASMSALERMLVQEYIEKPLLIERAKFDLRVYMLIASSDPWMVFYHPGYLRRSLFEYSSSSKNRAVYLTNTHYQSMKENFKLSEHIWTFERLQAYLTQHGRAGPHYVESILDPYVKRVANFIFQSAREKLERRKGSFHIFGLDFMIDEKFRVHFIEANGYPGYTWSLNFDTRGFVAEQFNLVLELHEHPTVFEKMRAGDRYGEYEMIFSELEETVSGSKYDPCYEFFANARSFRVLSSAMKRFSKYTGFAVMKQLEGMDDGECHSKLCKAKKRQAKKQAQKARKVADRLFNGFIDDIIGGEFIGGPKSDQISTLARFAYKSGCSLNKLFVLPATYRMYIKDDCLRALKYRTASAWIVKPMDGRNGNGFEYYDHQNKLDARFASCVDGLTKDRLKLSQSAEEHQKATYEAPGSLQFIAQKHILNRLVVKERMWDFRAYMLIASTDPFFVFYHDGYARSVTFSGSHNMNDDEEEPELDGNGNVIKRSESRNSGYTLGESELTFADFQVLLSKEAKTGDYFMTSAFQTYAKQVMRLLFHASKENLVSRTKSYQLFELNFIIDDTYTFWYVSANSSPQLSKTPRVRQNVLRPMQDDIKPLVLELSDTPEALAGMRYGDKYGGWRLVHSDYEDHLRNTTYNACREFKGKWTLSKSAVLGTAKVHDYKTRVENANARELKKYTRAAWDRCRQHGYKSETCMESESVINQLTKRYEAYLDKTSIIMSGDEHENQKQQDQREKDIQEYVQTRLREMAGLQPAGGASEK